jgi:hypothetical protein
MSTATLRSSKTIRSEDPSRLGWKGWLAIVALLAVLGFLVAWLLGWIRFTTDPRLVEVRQLQEKAKAAYGGGPATLADATAAISAMQEIREKTSALPPYLRAQAERQGGNLMGSMFRQQINAYFAAPPAQRRAELDRQIDLEELMRKAREAISAMTAAGQGNGRAAGGGPPAAPGGPPRGSEESRNRFVKSIIDRTTPEDRARYVEYRRAMEERREQRGLPNTGWGR